MDILFLPMRLTTLFLYVFLLCFLSYHYSRRVTYCIAAVSYLLGGFFEWQICHDIRVAPDLHAILILLAEGAVVCAVTYLLNEHRDTRAFLVFASACTYSLAAFLVGSIIYVFTDSSLAALFAQLAFSILILLLFNKENRDRPLSGLLRNARGRLWLCLVPVVVFVSLFCAAFWPGSIFHNPVCIPITIMLILLMFIYYALVIALLRIQEDEGWMTRNNELLETYTADLRKQMARMAEMQEQTAIVRHDRRHNVQLLEYYLDHGETDKIREMIASTNEKLKSSADRQFCGNPTMNWILNCAEKKAETSGIRFSCEAAVAELPSALEFELGTVVQNLLENAFYAASQLPAGSDRHVAFYAHPVKDQIFVEINNSYTGKLTFSSQNGLPISTKGEGHGYGLRSVLAFAGRYGASFDCSAENGTFRVRLLLPLNEEDRQENAENRQENSEKQAGEQ